MQYHDQYAFADQRTFQCVQHCLQRIFQNMPKQGHKNLAHESEHLHLHSRCLKMIEGYGSYTLASLLQHFYMEYQFDYVAQSRT